MLADAIDPLEDIFSDFMEESGAGDDTSLQACMEYINMDVTLYISKEDRWLVKCEADLKDSDLYGLLEEIDTGIAAEIINVVEDISFRECSVSFVFSGWNDTEAKVPGSVARDAVERPAGAGIFGTPELSVREEEQVGETERADIKPGWEETGDDSGNNNNNNVNLYPDGYIPLYKSAAPGELLCNVNIPDGWEYTDFMSNPADGYFYMGLTGEGLIEVRNEARSPLYDYLTYGYAAFEDENSPYGSIYQDYTCEGMEVIGTAFGGNDCVFVRESYYDVQFGLQFDTEYLVIEYDNNGSAEYLTVWIILGVGVEWSDSDYLKLARDLFGE